MFGQENVFSYNGHRLQPLHGIPSKLHGDISTHTHEVTANQVWKAALVPLVNKLCDATVFPRKFRRHVGKIVAIRLALQRRDILGRVVAIIFYAY